MPVYITVKYGEFQANSSSHLETRGLRWHDSANLASFSKFKNPRTMEGKITRSRRLLIFESRQKISGLESIWQLQNPGSMKKFRVIRKDPGLKSCSREVSLTEALNIRFTIRFKGNLFSHKALKRSNPVYQCPVQKGINFSQVRV